MLMTLRNRGITHGSVSVERWDGIAKACSFMVLIVNDLVLHLLLLCSRNEVVSIGFCVFCVYCALRRAALGYPVLAYSYTICWYAVLL